MVKAWLVVASVLLAGLCGCTSKTGGTSSELNPVAVKLVSEPALVLNQDNFYQIEVGSIVQWHVVGIWDGKNYDDKITSWRLDRADPPMGSITATGLYTAPDIPKPNGVSVSATGGSDPRLPYYAANQNFIVVPKATAQGPAETPLSETR
jgi:hypothetical protein